MDEQAVIKRDYSSNTEPYPHQWDEFVSYRDSAARCLAWGMRSGKTKAIIDLSEYLYRTGKIEALIVVTLNGVHQNWLIREFPIHCRTPWVGHAYKASAANTLYHKSSFANVCRKQNTGKLQVFTINAEAIRTETAKKHIANFIRGRKGKFLLCVDESHLFRTPSSSRSRVIRALAKQADYKRIMTGTLASNSPLHVWSQFEILEKGALGFNTFGRFKREYAIIGQGWASGRNFEEIRGWKNLEDLKQRIAKWTSVVRKEDIGMNGLDEVVRKVSMTEKQYKFYKKVEKECMVDDHSLEGAGKIGKLLQISRGWYYDPMGEPVYVVPPEDNVLLKSIINEIELTPGKIIVWCALRVDFDLMADALRRAGILFVQYRGGMDGDDKNQSLKTFREAKECKVFLGEPTTGGVGLPLEVADTIMWHSHKQGDNITREQANERASEIGKENVGLIDFSVDKSHSDYVIRSLKEKHDINEDIAGFGLRVVLEAENFV